MIPPSPTDELLLEQDGNVLTITFNRPDRLNAITGPMLAALSTTLQAANVDRDVRAIIITGAGRGFCSGLDLKAQGGDKSDGAIQLGGRGYQMFDLHNSPPIVINRMDKPIVCALNGAAAGYGMDLALGCDIRIASENAKMGAVFAKRGIVPESGGCWYLPRLLGWAKAAEVAFMGDVLDAQRSLELGLVNKVVPHDELMTEAKSWAHKIANNAPLAVQATKRMMRLGQDETFEAAVDHILLQLLPLAQTEDFKESLSAFAERREPAFKGR
ncbi:MAG: enoyl-CoA hydratase [Dehalococcoidia bacterium]|jgi:enoyl-CoA hydratase/carnithine racemase|uniref:enoyl-CoA hydratase/isomerase family protein n=1 Tax=Candidatus Amarobacter glycogenicus TaxID=3140699 RepID=UPI001DA2EFBC|nr:enoyl-CoA hydratase [Dehalococcoidia bacterium]MBK7328876.1 enoyl-CoA hydratase [Dehalococcoidia bacterium]MBK7725130.1 enoyl-CoA hydratase [Dehalococcoidia bacterium]MBK8558921.1 enoyl-CoA hydratase [Dehalococcoidia bacterium]MBK9343658.1 enoyl-CoA hydratase [Dehalococcoidia bacterium]